MVDVSDPSIVGHNEVSEPTPALWGGASQEMEDDEPVRLNIYDLGKSNTVGSWVMYKRRRLRAQICFLHCELRLRWLSIHPVSNHWWPNQIPIGIRYRASMVGWNPSGLVPFIVQYRCGLQTKHAQPSRVWLVVDVCVKGSSTVPMIFGIEWIDWNIWNSSSLLRHCPALLSPGHFTFEKRKNHAEFQVYGVEWSYGGWRAAQEGLKDEAQTGVFTLEYLEFGKDSVSNGLFFFFSVKRT